MFNWVTGNAQLEIVTLNSNNITLNQNAASHFQSSQYVLVGFSQNLEIGIKPVSKRDMDLNAYPKENLHKISIGKGYAKINNKALCDLISAKVGKPLTGQKIYARFDETENVLIFDIDALSNGEEVLV